MSIEISKKIISTFGRTNAHFKLIQEGDKILVGLSGGKDSLLLSTLLARHQRHSPCSFEFKAVTIDYGIGEDFSYLCRYCQENDIPHEVIKTDIMAIMQEKRRENSSYCSFCSRMRRGALYTQALEGGFNKLALGHHLDDAVESFFMNFSYNGAIRSMPPIYEAENGLKVIRPLIWLRERQMIDFVTKNQIQTPLCNCPAQHDKPPYARESTKNMLKSLEEQNHALFVSLKSAFMNLHENTFMDSRFLDNHQEGDKCL
ncbi:tRNA 2-thiocytidine(32) synthetase TtcA [Helicobacter monodelphidis]|uniref:tRNA 2-thiocytidine biosynthesis TtcA family protein n=1 Tax=Helicobacter sp. 15-1451 TaxID=2004995 RepID=UPI000DCB5104|nr:ATP-binding protein [Helicobacter sp. 15-1451]RAX57896.1 tRNA 2-thiocytidine(32) synthetase TtcA [Helicobacter sp. 15-1451]